MSALNPLAVARLVAPPLSILASVLAHAPPAESAGLDLRELDITETRAPSALIEANEAVIVTIIGRAIRGPSQAAQR